MLNRAVLSDNGVLSDKTAALDDYYATNVTVAMTVSEDKLYLGSKYPLSRKYLKVATANVVTAALAVRYWDGSQWRSAATIDDATAVAGVPLAASGYVGWEPDARYPWAPDNTTANGVNRITGFGTTNYQGYYWVELSYSATISAALAWFGDLFCTDNDLGAEYPDLNRSTVMTAFAAGKTSWEEQRVAACKIVSADLRAKVIAADSGLVETAALRLPAISKTAELIFRGLGQGYADSKTDASTEYAKRMTREALVTDRNGDGITAVDEAGAPQVTRIYR